MASCVSPLRLKVDAVTGTRYHDVPCGKCNFCLARLRADWTYRLKQELKVCRSAHFLTLTYDEAKLPYVDVVDDASKVTSTVPTLVKSDLQRFMKRLRKKQVELGEGSGGGVSGIRYYAVGEYGSKTDRPHYHVILFNLTEFLLSSLSDIWGHGSVHRGEVNGASIHYCTKFHLNKHLNWDEQLFSKDVREPPFLLYQIGVVASA